MFQLNFAVPPVSFDFYEHFTKLHRVFVTGVNTSFVMLYRLHAHGFFVLGNSFSRRLPDLQVRVESAYPSSATAWFQAS